MKKSQKQTSEPAIERGAAETTEKHSGEHLDASILPSKKEKVIKKSHSVPHAASGQRSKSNTGSVKLVCRYCGSDDLAPSFIKRRDARCRACFKQRYGSAKRNRENRKVASA